ncbi:Endonuclease V-like isoform X2 [Oopsacas minuta]|uniref:Endonuclease V-like isoform X2 n=1 Tax=Oopsacas minuta TaxID=111878 RepID=A0AAV7JMC4_9METZ|nr:Endonuclease V-like isoform X2 [Oopsacas minuta]
MNSPPPTYSGEFTRIHSTPLYSHDYQSIGHSSVSPSTSESHLPLRIETDGTVSSHTTAPINTHHSCSSIEQTHELIFPPPYPSNVQESASHRSHTPSESLLNSSTILLAVEEHRHLEQGISSLGATFYYTSAITIFKVFLFIFHIANIVIASINFHTCPYKETAMVELTLPYIPGFLAFREVPFLNDRLNLVIKNHPELIPEVILVDGNGILHTRGFGLASQLGVMSDIPTIGVAKTLFSVDGLYKDRKHMDSIAALRKAGDSFPLIGHSGKTWGMALLGQDNVVNPVYVSVGHKICLETAKELVFACSRSRIPEPVRQADLRSREFIRKLLRSKQPSNSYGKRQYKGEYKGKGKGKSGDRQKSYSKPRN